MTPIPAVADFVIGGSSTFSIRFPEDLGASGVNVAERRLVFRTPFGDSPPLKLFTVDGRPVLTAKMHGWRPGVNRADASRQLFWVMQQAGVQRVWAEGGVGAINHLLDLRDLMVPTDYIDQSLRKDVSLGTGNLLVMRDPFCPVLRRRLLDAAGIAIRTGTDPRRIFGRGVYANTDGRHFESRAEIRALAQMGADVVGQSICPEVYLAREIGACFAGIYMMVNFAEGVVEDWRHDDLKDIFYGQSHTIGGIVLEALRRREPTDCTACTGLRKPSLLMDQEYTDEAGGTAGC